MNQGIMKFTQSLVVNQGILKSYSQSGHGAGYTISEVKCDCVYAISKTGHD